MWFNTKLHGKGYQIKKRREARREEKQVLHGCQKFVLRDVRLSPETNEIWKRLGKKQATKDERELNLGRLD